MRSQRRIGELVHEPAAANITTADEGTVRLGPLLGLPDIVAAFGVSFDELLDEVGLSRELFTDSENTMAVRDAARLPALCAEHCGTASYRRGMQAEKWLAQ